MQFCPESEPCAFVTQRLCLANPFFFKQTSSLKPICMQLKCNPSVSLKLQLTFLVVEGRIIRGGWTLGLTERLTLPLLTNINFPCSQLKQNIAICSWVILRST